MNPSLQNRTGSVVRFGGAPAPLALALALVAAVSWPAATSATAAPTFQLLPSGTTPIQAEAVADPGGTSYSGTTWPAGKGLPTAQGGWPLVSGTYPPGFGPDASFGNAYGITGFHSSNLYLTEDALVTFEFGGSGDAIYQNRFFVNDVLLYDNKTASTNGPNTTGPYYFTAGFIPFKYVANVTGTEGFPTTTIVNGSNTANPATAAAFYIGFDPYAVSGTFTTSGTASVYMGLSDHAEGAGDHDFQDLTIKVSIVGVPEPGAVALAAIGAVGVLAAVRGTRRGGCAACTVGRKPDQEPTPTAPPKPGG